MLNDNGHIDKMFSEGLKDLSVQPRPELWGKINADLKLGRRKKRAVVIFISLAAAASLALLFTLSNSLFFHQDIEMYQKKSFAELKTNSNIENFNIDLENAIPEKSQLSDAVIQPDFKSRFQSSPGFTKKPLGLNDTIQKSEMSIQMVLPKSKMITIDNSTLSMQLFDKRINKRDITTSTFIQDSLIIARNLRMLAQFDKAEGKKKEWSILGQISSAYSSNKGDKSGNKSEDGLLSIGGGVKLIWQTGKKLAIQTGVIYNKFGQELGQEISGDNQVFSSLAFNGALTKQVDFNSNVQTSAGEIKMKGSSILYNSNEDLTTRSSSSPDMIQSFEAIEIPLILKYSLIDRKFGLHLSGGISTNLMIGNRVYDKSTRETLGETSDIRSTNFSTSFSMGMEYQLNSKFSLSLEPSLKYYLNSISNDSEINFKPYSIGLSSGIRYKF